MAVPPDSWQVGPANRWAYVHVDEMLPVALVPRGPSPAPPLPARLVALDDLAFAGTRLDAFVHEGYVDGLAVAHDGALVFERYAGEMGPGSLHLSQSVAKSVLGLLVGALVGRGALDPGSLVTDHVPEVARSGYAGATIAQVLDMTAAVDFVEDYANFWRYDAACGWHPRVAGAHPESVLEFLPTIGPAAWRHGERFHYSSPSTDLLGLVAERAGGAPLATLIGRELWAPLGAERDAQLTIDPSGTGVISGGFCATLRDYLRLGLLVLEGGRGVVPEPWIRALGAGDPAAFARPTVAETTSGASGYAKQWWRRDDRTVARGIHGQLVTIDPRARVVVAILSSWPAATDPALEAAQRALVAAVCDALA